MLSVVPSQINLIYATLIKSKLKHRKQSIEFKKALQICERKINLCTLTKDRDILNSSVENKTFRLDQVAHYMRVLKPISQGSLKRKE